MSAPRLSGARLRLLSLLTEWPLVGWLIARLGFRALAAPLAAAREDLPPPLYTPAEPR